MRDNDSLNLREATIATAGAYVLIDGCYVFAIGPTPSGNALAVFRLGGHREAHETVWQCAAREAYEEACIQIQPLSPPTTYWMDANDVDVHIQSAAWPFESVGEPLPFCVVSLQKEGTQQFSVMYLAQADEPPAPASEIRGLLLLTPADVLKVVYESVTLQRYLCEGGKAILQADFDEYLPLKPLLQLRMLARILQIHSSMTHSR
jgi:ADP-ribose pyrophosphatase YjhB (NUDIX family)